MKAQGFATSSLQGNNREEHCQCIENGSVLTVKTWALLAIEGSVSKKLYNPTFGLKATDVKCPMAHFLQVSVIKTHVEDCAGRVDGIFHRCPL